MVCELLTLITASDTTDDTKTETNTTDDTKTETDTTDDTKTETSTGLSRPLGLAQAQACPPLSRCEGAAGEEILGVMRDQELDILHNAELKEAFDEFDKVKIMLSSLHSGTVGAILVKSLLLEIIVSCSVLNQIE